VLDFGFAAQVLYIQRERGGEVFILGCLAGGSPVNIYIRSGLAMVYIQEPICF
jgi:hypothetical protein